MQQSKPDMGMIMQLLQQMQGRFGQMPGDVSESFNFKPARNVAGGEMQRLPGSSGMPMDEVLSMFPSGSNQAIGKPATYLEPKQVTPGMQGQIQDMMSRGNVIDLAGQAAGANRIPRQPSQSRNSGMQRVSPGLYRDSKGALVRRGGK